MNYTAKQSFVVFETVIQSKSSSDAIDVLNGLKKLFDYLGSNPGKESVLHLLRRVRQRLHSHISIRVSLDVLYQDNPDETNTAVLSQTSRSEEYY